MHPLIASIAWVYPLTYYDYRVVLFIYNIVHCPLILIPLKSLLNSVIWTASLAVLPFYWVDFLVWWYLFNTLSRSIGWKLTHNLQATQDWPAVSFGAVFYFLCIDQIEEIYSCLLVFILWFIFHTPHPHPVCNQYF